MCIIAGGGASMAVLLDSGAILKCILHPKVSFHSLCNRGADVTLYILQ